MQKYYTPEEVARELRVTRRTVYEWLTSGRLRGLRAGTRWRIRTEDVAAFMQGAQRGIAPVEVTAEERAARIRAARGALAHVPLNVDEFIRWKREDVERESQEWTAGASAELVTSDHPDFDPVARDGFCPVRFIR